MRHSIFFIWVTFNKIAILLNKQKAQKVTHIVHNFLSHCTNICRNYCAMMYHGFQMSKVKSHFSYLSDDSSCLNRPFLSRTSCKPNQILFWLYQTCMYLSRAGLKVLCWSGPQDAEKPPKAQIIRSDPSKPTRVWDNQVFLTENGPLKQQLVYGAVKRCDLKSFLCVSVLWVTEQKLLRVN